MMQANAQGWFRRIKTLSMDEKNVNFSGKMGYHVQKKVHKLFKYF